MLNRWVCEGFADAERLERCNGMHTTRGSIWDCPGCDTECCDDCFDRYAHCRTCAKGKTDEELRLAANANGYDYEPDENGGDKAKTSPRVGVCPSTTNLI